MSNIISIKLENDYFMITLPKMKSRSYSIKNGNRIIEVHECDSSERFIIPKREGV